MRLAFVIVMVLLSSVSSPSGKELSFSPTFVSDFEAVWHASKRVKVDRTALHDATRTLFDTRAAPKFPGLASMLLDDAAVLENADSMDAAHDARKIACLVSECSASVHWRLMTHEVFAGNGLAVLAHFSGLVVGVVDLFKWIGGPLSLSTGLTLALTFGALLFVVLAHAGRCD